MSTMAPRWSALQLLVGTAGKMTGSVVRSASSSALVAQRWGLGEVEEPLLALAPTLSRRTQLRLHNITIRYHIIGDIIYRVSRVTCEI